MFESEFSRYLIPDKSYYILILDMFRNIVQRYSLVDKLYLYRIKRTE